MKLATKQLERVVTVAKLLFYLEKYALYIRLHHFNRCEVDFDVLYTFVASFLHYFLDFLGGHVVLYICPFQEFVWHVVDQERTVHCFSEVGL